MNIGIVGLGLIGGSIAKAIKSYTSHKVFGADINKEVELKAIEDGSVDGILKLQEIKNCDIIFLALYPNAAIKYAKDIAAHIQKNAILIDLCGVKRTMTKSLAPLALKHGFYFLGGHPMAGREVSGYVSAVEDLFKGASMILTPDNSLPLEIISLLQNFFMSIGFGQIKITDDETHDKMIAYTSQLAHVLSNAYIKSPLALEHKGFSAGSFQDLTRVAFLNAEMWAELFIENSDFLTKEIDGLCRRLSEYSLALKNQDEEELIKLLQEGSDQKLKTL